MAFTAYLGPGRLLGINPFSDCVKHLSAKMMSRRMLPKLTLSFPTGRKPLYPSIFQLGLSKPPQRSPQHEAGTWICPSCFVPVDLSFFFLLSAFVHVRITCIAGPVFQLLFNWTGIPSCR